MNSVLVIEDDADSCEMLCSILTRDGFNVDSLLEMAEINKLQQKLEQDQPDLILMDQMLFGHRQGSEMVKELRTQPRFQHIPVIMVSGCSSEDEKVYGLSAGADDYITKPFSHRELVARVRAVLRRQITPTKKTWFTHKNLVLDVGGHRALIDDQEIALTLTEFKILNELVAKSGSVLNRTDLCEKILGRSNVTDRTIDVHVASLRKKLGGFGPSIKTVRGVGYKIV